MKVINFFGIKVGFSLVYLPSPYVNLISRILRRRHFGVVYENMRHAKNFDSYFGCNFQDGVALGQNVKFVRFDDSCTFLKKDVAPININKSDFISIKYNLREFPRFRYG